jgi:hypothetical protein
MNNRGVWMVEGTDLADGNLNTDSIVLGIEYKEVALGIMSATSSLAGDIEYLL